MIEELKQRRKRQWLAAIPGIAAVLVVLLATDRTGGTLFGLSSTTLAVGAGARVVAYVLFSIRNWRCPGCDKYLGKNMNPSFCPSCGVKLAQ